MSYLKYLKNGLVEWFDAFLCLLHPDWINVFAYVIVALLFTGLIMSLFGIVIFFDYTLSMLGVFYCGLFWYAIIIISILIVSYIFYRKSCNYR